MPDSDKKIKKCRELKLLVESQTALVRSLCVRFCCGAVGMPLGSNKIELAKPFLSPF